MKRPDRIQSTLMVLGLLAAAMLFLLRGPWRAVHGGANDFASQYVSSIKYNRHLNPYSWDDFFPIWHTAGAPATAMVSSSDRRPIYPPSTLILMSPFGRLSWPHAVAIYVFTCSAFFVYLLYLLAKLIDDDWLSWRRWGFLAFGLALAPVHTSLSLANLTIACFLLCMFCLLLAQRGNDLAAGVLLALALCLKPTTGILLLPYFLFSRRWKLLAAGVCLAGSISAAAMLHMASLPYPWLTNYRQNAAYIFGPDGVNNFASPWLRRFDILNLQVPFFEMTRSRLMANLLSWLVSGLLAAAWIRFFLRKKEWTCHWEASGAAILIGILPLYQRNYNAAFVLIAILWAFQNLERPLAKWILAVSVIFLVPGEAFLRHLNIPNALSQNLVWKVVVMPQATWGVLALAVLLLGAMAGAAKPAPEKAA